MERYSRDERALYRAYLELLSTAIRAAESEIVGRPVGDAAFVDSLEARVGRPLRRAKPGRPRKSED